MFEPPDLDDATLARCVESAWGIDVSSVRFMPVGLDGWAYQVNSPEDRFFLKVKRDFPGEAAILVPQFLFSQGITQVVAPIETASRQPVHVVNGHFLLLYPYVDGDDLWDAGLTDRQWIEYGQILSAMHRAPLPARIDVPRETFTTTAPERIDIAADAVAHSPCLVDHWPGWRDRIQRLAGMTRMLADQAAAGLTDPAARAAMVLCHADIHPGNLVADAAGGLHVVDWDAPLIAPRERDLMFVLGGDFGAHPINPHRERLFWQGYGPFDPNPLLMAYYRCERTLDDIALFVADVLEPATGDATRQLTVRLLRQIIDESLDSLLESVSKAHSQAATI